MIGGSNSSQSPSQGLCEAFSVSCSSIHLYNYYKQRYVISEDKSIMDLPLPKSLQRGLANQSSSTDQDQLALLSGRLSGAGQR